MRASDFSVGGHPIFKQKKAPYCPIGQKESLQGFSFYITPLKIKGIFALYTYGSAAKDME